MFKNEEALKTVSDSRNLRESVAIHRMVKVISSNRKEMIISKRNLEIPASKNKQWKKQKMWVSAIDYPLPSEF